MRVSLNIDPSKKSEEIHVRVEISEIDDPPKFTYSHSFRYNLPSAKNITTGGITIYTDGTKDEEHTPFSLEKCRNEECKKDPNGCPVIACEDNRLLVADIFHTMPKKSALQTFGGALFKALFSAHAAQLLQEIEPNHPNGRIFLQLNDNDLEAIPWEYANDGSEFLVRQRWFTRIHHQQKKPQLSKLPLRILTVAPDPVIPPDNPDAKLPDLCLNERYQYFINEHNFNKKIILEHVYPPTVYKMNELLLKDPKTATALHFMGHSSVKNGARRLIFEHSKTGEHELVDTSRLSNSRHLRLAFLSACNTREVARDLLKKGVPYTIGSNCPIPDDLAHKFESKFYQLLANGFEIEKAMREARKFLNEQDDIRQSDYFPGALVLYSSFCWKDDGKFKCEDGKPTVQLHMPQNNLQSISRTLTFYGRKKELMKLNSVLRDMADNSGQSQVSTISGIGGQGKTALAMEAVSRTAHLFQGGVFAWAFDRKPISVAEYLHELVDVLFSKEAQLKSSHQDDVDGIRGLGQAILKKFADRRPCLLILDHADTLSFAEAQGQKDAKTLVAWFKHATSCRNFGVKILATSHSHLSWPTEQIIPLIGLDGDSGGRLFNENLSIDKKKKMKKETTAQLLSDLVSRVDGHPLSLMLLGRAAGRPQYLDKQLKDIVHEPYYNRMIADEDMEKKELEKHFEPMVSALTPQEQLFLYMCSLFTGPITPAVLVFISHLIDYNETSAKSVDFSIENIEENLKQLNRHRLLYENGKEYRIHIGLKEGLRQHSIKPKPQLCLSIPNTSTDSFIVGIPCEHGKLTKLEWQLNGRQFDASTRVRSRNFDIRHRSIGMGNTGLQIADIFFDIKNSLKKSLLMRESSRCGLIFLYKVSETPFDDFNQLCKEKIIPIVTEERMPFILCLYHADEFVQENSLETELLKLDLMIQFTEALRASLETKHWIIRTEVSSVAGHPEETSMFAETFSASKFKAGNESVSMVFPRGFANVYTYGEFIGRQSELQKLKKLLTDKKTRFITIRGSGGIGKTALAFEAIKNFNYGRVLVQSLAGNPNSDSVISRIAEFLSIDVAAITDPTLLQTEVIQKMSDSEPILLYFDNMEDLEQATKAEKVDPSTKDDASSLIQFLHTMPENVKVLATSRVEVGRSNEEILMLDILEPRESMRIFQKCVPNGLNYDMITTCPVIGHPLSIRLLGGSLHNMKPMLEFIDDLKQLQKKADCPDKYYNSCIHYAYNHLEHSLQSFLGHLRLFQTPVTVTLLKKTLNYDNASSSEMFDELWKKSWLNELQYDPTLGDWRPKFMEQDTKFFTLHPRVRDYLDDQVGDVEGNSFSILNDKEVQFYTALCYGVGFGVAINLEKQIEWCTLAAENGYLEAQLTLAAICEHRANGMDEAAFNWYLQAAKAGDKSAQQRIEAWYQKEYEYWRRISQDNEEEPLEIKFDITLPLLHRAAENNQVALVRSLLEQSSTNVDAEDRHGRTALYIAAQKGYVELLNLLGSEFNANANVKDKDGRTPLHRAADNKHFKAVHLLVTKLGADVKAESKDGQVLLHYLARDGQVELVKLFATELRAYKNAKDNKRRTPLHRAAANGHVEVVKILVTKFEASANLEDMAGLTPLFLAADNQHIEVVRWLVEKPKVNDDNKDRDGRTLLHRAIDTGLVEVVKLLVADLGANVNAKDNDGRPLLHRAADKGQFGIVNLLAIELGADIDAKDNKGRTLLHLAAEKGNIEILRLLVVELGANTNTEGYRGRTPLHEAVDNERFETLKLLVLELGADINIKDEDGRTPLHLATENERIEAMNLLVSLGADINVNDNDGGTPLHRASGKGCIEAMKLLVTRLGADTNVKDNDGRTPLHRASENGRIEAMKLLVTELGIDTNVKDNDGGTPLHRASENGHIKAIKLLVNELRADINVKDKGQRTPLYRAAANGHVKAMRLLVTQLGADANAKDSHGRTSLHRAVDEGRVEVIKLLVKELGVNVNIKDDEGKTPLHRAADNDFVEIMRLLVTELGANVNVKDKSGQTLLDIAVLNGQVKLMELLINELGANATIDSDGKAMLYQAVCRGRVEVVKLLMPMVLPKELDFKDKKIGDEGAHALAESLKHNTTLTQLNLEDNSIGAEGTCALAESLKQNTILTYLNLQKNKIDTKGVCSLAKSLRQNKALTRLDLGGSISGSEGARELAGLLKQNTILTQLHFGNNEIGEKGALALADSLTQNRTLTELHLQGNIINTKGACAIADSLKSNATLTHLILKDNDIGEEGARALAESLKQNTTLTHLNLKKNHIGNKGACTLAESLKQNRTIIFLSLENNHINAEGAIALSESLKQNKALMQLALKENSIGAEGARALAESLKQNMTLIRLDIEENNIRADGARYLAESLKQNKTLTQLNLERNSIGAEGAHALIESLKQNTTLTQLNIEKNGISNEDTRALTESLKRNTALIKFLKNIDLLQPELDDADAKDNEGRPRHGVEWHKRSEAIKLFSTECGIESNTKTKTGLTPLHIIAAHGHMRAVKLLVKEYGADVNAQDDNGWTPLHMAAACGHIEVVRMLVMLGANPNVNHEKGQTPLYRAAEGGHSEVVKLLLDELHAEAEAKNSAGLTALLLAARSHPDPLPIITLLHDRGCNINAIDNDGATIHHYLTANTAFEDITRVMRSLPIQYEPNAKDAVGTTPIHWFFEKDSHPIELLKWMIDSGGDVGAIRQPMTSRNGTYPGFLDGLADSVRVEAYEITEYLLEKRLGNPSLSLAVLEWKKTKITDESDIRKINDLSTKLVAAEVQWGSKSKQHKDSSPSGETVLQTEINTATVAKLNITTTLGRETRIDSESQTKSPKSPNSPKVNSSPKQSAPPKSTSAKAHKEIKPSSSVPRSKRNVPQINLEPPSSPIRSSSPGPPSPGPPSPIGPSKPFYSRVSTPRLNTVNAPLLKPKTSAESVRSNLRMSR